MASNSHIFLRGLESGEQIPTHILNQSRGLRDSTEKFLGSVLAIGFQKFSSLDDDTHDFLVGASPSAVTIVGDNMFTYPIKSGSTTDDLLLQRQEQRDFENATDYWNTYIERWKKAQENTPRLRINEEVVNSQAFALFHDEPQYTDAELADLFFAGVEKVVRSDMKASRRIGFVSGGDAELVFVDTVNSQKLVVS